MYFCLHIRYNAMHVSQFYIYKITQDNILRLSIHSQSAVFNTELHNKTPIQLHNFVFTQNTASNDAELLVYEQYKCACAKSYLYFSDATKSSKHKQCHFVVLCIGIVYCYDIVWSELKHLAAIADAEEYPYENPPGAE